MTTDNHFDISEGENFAYKRICKARWPKTNGEPVCPRCGHDHIYRLKPRKKYNCAGCRTHFSALSGTIFDRSKLSFAELVALVDKIGEAKTLQKIVDETGHQLKTVLVTRNKIIEAAMLSQGHISPEEPDAILRSCLSAPISDHWKGYWQRNQDAPNPAP